MHESVLYIPVCPLSRQLYLFLVLGFEKQRVSELSALVFVDLRVAIENAVFVRKEWFLLVLCATSYMQLMVL